MAMTIRMSRGYVTRRGIAFTGQEGRRRRRRVPPGRRIAPGWRPPEWGGNRPKPRKWWPPGGDEPDWEELQPSPGNGRLHSITDDASGPGRDSGSREHDDEGREVRLQKIAKYGEAATTRHTRRAEHPLSTARLDQEGKENCASRGNI